MEGHWDISTLKIYMLEPSTTEAMSNGKPSTDHQVEC